MDCYSNSVIPVEIAAAVATAFKLLLHEEGGEEEEQEDDHSSWILVLYEEDY
jgi:hypothetical protein